MTTIEEYSKEIGLHRAMTVDELVESHRRLRAVSAQKHEEWLEEIAKGREIGRLQGLEQVTQGEFIAVEDLRNMTMLEISNILHSN